LLRLAGEGANFGFAFGAGSLAKHREEAGHLHLASTVYDAPGIGFDLDTPDDWDDFLAGRDELSPLRLPFPSRRAGNGADNGKETSLAEIMAKCGAGVG
jgi:hypothetical protein